MDGGVYVTDHPIESLGAMPGDLVIIRPADAANPLLVVRRFDRNRLPLILDDFDQLRPTGRREKPWRKTEVSDEDPTG